MQAWRIASRSLFRLGYMLNIVVNPISRLVMLRRSVASPLKASGAGLRGHGASEPDRCGAAEQRPLPAGVGRVPKKIVRIFSVSELSNPHYLRASISISYLAVHDPLCHSDVLRSQDGNIPFKEIRAPASEF